MTIMNSIIKLEDLYFTSKTEVTTKIGGILIKRNNGTRSSSEQLFQLSRSLFLLLLP